jgi:hypothetical protein
MDVVFVDRRLGREEDLVVGFKMLLRGKSALCLGDAFLQCIIIVLGVTALGCEDRRILLLAMGE